MRKRSFWHRVLSVSMVLLFACACALPGRAVSLGTYEDNPIEAGLRVFVEEDQQSAYSLQSTWQLFTMEAQQVTMLITTRSSGKWFTKDDLVHGGLLIQGSCQYSQSGTQYDAGLGACVYWAAAGQYFATHYVEDTTIFEVYPVSDFDDDETYYGYIRNLRESETDYVTGRLTFYDTNEA